MAGGEETELTIAGAVEQFFGDLRLAPRSKKTYRHGVAKFVRHLADNEGIDPDVAPVSSITNEHVTQFAALLVPSDVRSPEEVSQMRTAQNNLSAVRKFCAYLSSYDFNSSLSGERLKTRIAAMMPRFTPPPPDVKLSDLEAIVDFVNRQPREPRPHLELRRLKVRAMIRFLFRSGVRVSELCALRRRDIDLAGGTANIYRAKGGKSRTVHFDADTAEALTAYWIARGDAVRGAGALPAFSGRDKVGKAGHGDQSPHGRAHRRRAGRGSRHRKRGDAALLPARPGDGVGAATGPGVDGTDHFGSCFPATTRIYVHKTAMEVAEEYQDAFGPYRPPPGAGFS